MGIIHTALSIVSEEDALNNLKKELAQWRESRARPGSVPDELRKKVLALHGSGVPVGRFKSMGLGHSQIHNWLSKLSEPEGSEKAVMNFAQVFEKKTAQGNPATALPPSDSLLNQGQSLLPIHLSVKQGLLELSVTCTDIEVATQLLKTALGCSNATTHTAS